MYFATDVWPLPVVPEGQQRAAAVHPKATLSGPDDLPAQPLRDGAGNHRDIGERSRR